MSVLTSLQVDSVLSYAIAVVLPALDAIFPVVPSETAITTSSLLAKAQVSRSIEYSSGTGSSRWRTSPAAYSARSWEPGSVPGLTSLRDPAPGAGSRAAPAPAVA